MDVAIPVMLDPELASDMVKLFGEELKRVRARMRVLEEELHAAREASLLRLDQEEKPDVRHDPSQRTIVELREAIRSRDEELRGKAEMLAALEHTVSEKDEALRSCAEEAAKKQETITKLADTNAQLRKSITRIREAAHARAQQAAAQARQPTVIESKIQPLEEIKRQAQATFRTLTRERDEARAAKSEQEQKCRSQSVMVERLKAERDKFEAEAKRYQAEAAKWQAEAEGLQAKAAEKRDADASRRKADLSKAPQPAQDPGWATKFDRFLAMMQSLPEPTEALPPAEKIKSCLLAGCIGHTPRVFEVIHQVYDSHSVIYLPDLPLWHPASRHGIAVIPEYTYVPNAAAHRAEWVRNSLREAVHGQTRELFYRENASGKITYAGTYKLLAGPTLLGVTPADHARLSLPANMMKMLARRTLDAVAERDQGMFDIVVAAYTQGVLPFSMLGLQCVGYKAGFDEPLRAWAARNTKPVPASESGAATGAASTKASRVEAGCQVASVAESAKPQLGIKTRTTGASDVVIATEQKVTTSAKPKKRNRDSAAIVDSRKRSRKTTELIVEPVPPKPTKLVTEVKCEAESDTEAAPVKAESA